MKLKFKTKKGITMLLFAVIGTVLVFFTALILDIGRGYVYQEKLQGIADACSTAGAAYGKKTSKSKYIDSNGVERVAVRIEIDKNKAESKARELFQDNIAGIANEFTVKPAIIFNDSIPGLSSKELYSLGVMNVHVKGTTKGLILGRSMKLNRISTTALNTKVEKTQYTKGYVEIKESYIYIYDENGNLIRKEPIKN